MIRLGRRSVEILRAFRVLPPIDEEHFMSHMSHAPAAHALMLRSLPHLRAFAISLTGDVTRADDLVQEALLRGLSNLNRFEPGTNMQAWLFTILRNLFHTEFRKRRREIEDVDGAISARVPVLPEQEGHVAMGELQAALAKLSPEHREALVLIGAQGLSYEETARICGTHVGTIKSRMNRARARLAELMGVTADDLGSDRYVQAVLSQPVREPQHA
jgi:RNA polymerase sigma-70 factor (ECF subfamily)